MKKRKSRIRKRVEEFAKNNGIRLKKPNQKVFKIVYDDTKSRERALICANRYTNEYNITKFKTTPLNVIMSKKFIKKLPDIDNAVDVIKKHMVNNSRILQVTDYDVDGITAGVIGYKVMKNIFKYKRFKVLINQRSWKNGMNDTIITTILEMHKKKPIGLVITSDHGSSDGSRLKKLMENGIDVVVTDHHLPSEVDPPKDVNAWVNPKRYDSLFINDISGSAVLFFTYYYHYLKNFKIDKDTIDKFYKLLTYVGLTTISDSMDMRDIVNRKIVRYMLNLLNSETKIDAFWDTIKNELKSCWFIDQELLSFNLIPKLNSPGRISDPVISFRLMISEKEEEVLENLEAIYQINVERKVIQNKSKEELDI